jgi:hypothetical protein
LAHGDLDALGLDHDLANGHGDLHGANRSARPM